MATGKEILGVHLYDILSPSSPEVLTIGNTSNHAYLRLYDSNLPRNGVLMGLSNQGFIFYRDNGSNLNVGINTYIPRTNLDIQGTLALNQLTTYNSNITILNNVYLSNASLGIGTQTPSKKLDVRGDVVFSDRLFHNGEEYRESQFKYLYGSNYTSNVPSYMLSNIYYLHNVGIGTNSSNELVNYQLFVKGNTAIDGKIYATDFVSYGGVAANSFLQVELFESGNNRLKNIVTNDTNLRNRILYSIRTRPGRYLFYANIPYRNLSPYIFIDNQNWIEVCLYRFKTPDTFTSDADPYSLITLDVRSVSPNVSTQMIEFFVDSVTDSDYIIAVRGKGHLIEFGSLESSSLQVLPIKGIGNDDSYTVRKALQPTPIRYTKIIDQLTSNFSFSTEGRYTAEASNVDVFINGTKYIYQDVNHKDYDVTYGYDYTANRTTFNITLTEPVLTEDIVHLAIWPYVTADTIFNSGYYYQNVVAYPSQWLNILDGGIRYPKRVVIDGDLIVKGNFVGGCNTDLFYAGADLGSLNITCNVIGTFNMIDGAVNTQKLAVNSVTNEKIVNNTIRPTKLNLKDDILYVGCNYGEMDAGLLTNRRGILIEGDVYLTGQLTASNIAGNKESIADNSIETRKYKDNSITFEKISFNSIDNLLLRNNIIATRNLRANCVITSNVLNQAITFDKLSLNSIYRSNITPGSISSNEIANFSITSDKLNLYTCNLGIGLSNQTAQEKLHVVGNLLMDGNILTAQTNTYNIGSTTKRFKDVYLGGILDLNSVKLEKNNYIDSPGINIINRTTGAPAKCLVGDFITSNIGIGTEYPINGLDINYGNIALRNGYLGIGTTLPRFSIDALNSVNSTFMVGNIGIGTTQLYNNQSSLSIYGGLFINNSSNRPISVNPVNGNIGIGTTVAYSNLTIFNTDTYIENSLLNLQTSKILLNDSYDPNYTLNVSGKTKLTGNVEIVGDLQTSNVYAQTSNNSIGTTTIPFNELNIQKIVMNPNGQTFEKMDIQLYDLNIYKGDNYTMKNSDSLYNSRVYSVNRRMIFTQELDFLNFYPFRNGVINGNMNIEQRYYGSNITVHQNTPANLRYCLDRHFTSITNSTAQLIVSKSNVFYENYFSSKVGVATSTLTATTTHQLFNHKIEGSIVNMLNWGTSNAFPISISFKLKSDVLTTYYLSIHNHDRTRSLIREIPVTQTYYPERYTYIIEGDKYGSWLTNTNTGIWMSINNAVGTTYQVAPSLSNQWLNTTHYALSDSGGNLNYISQLNQIVFITNVQVEGGGMPTTFEVRPFSIEMMLCKRYFEKSYNYEDKLQTNTKSGMVMVLNPYTVQDTLCGTISFTIPKRISTWTGAWYSPTTEIGRIGYRSTSSPYNVTAFIGTINYYSTDGLFAEKSQNGFSYHFNVPAQASRNYCFHWHVDAEL